MFKTESLAELVPGLSIGQERTWQSYILRMQPLITSKTSRSIYSTPLIFLEEETEPCGAEVSFIWSPSWLGANQEQSPGFLTIKLFFSSLLLKSLLAIIYNDRTKLERMTFPQILFFKIINILKNDKMPEAVCSDVFKLFLSVSFKRHLLCVFLLKRFKEASFPSL